MILSAERFIQPSPAQHRSSAIVNHFAQQQFLIGLERFPRPFDDTIEQREVAPVSDRRSQRATEQRRDVEFAQPLVDRGLDHPAHFLWIERAEQIGEHARCAFLEPSVGRPLRGQKARRRSREIEPRHAPRHHRGGQEIVLEKHRQRVADAILVARDDRGVRDRQAERMAEQRGDREPVREATDHRRFGKGADEPGGQICRLELPRDQICRGHQHQQAGGDDLHSRRAGLGEEGRFHLGTRAPQQSRVVGPRLARPPGIRGLDANFVAGVRLMLTQPEPPQASQHPRRRWSASATGAGRARFRRRPPG